MGVAIYVLADTPPGRPEELFERIRRFFAESCADTLERAQVVHGGDGLPVLTFKLHPCAEDVEIAIAGERQVSVSAKTSSVGPGYHIYLCQTLRRLGEKLELGWQPRDDAAAVGDRTGYFHDCLLRAGDDVPREALDREMLAWIGDVAARVLQMPRHSRVALSMPSDHVFEAEGHVLTPLGPRDHAWLERTAADPKNAKDFFPWWEEGTGPEYQLGRALCLMWSDVRWRPPLDPDERRRMDTIVRLLEEAHRMDASLDYPWREWRELLGHLKSPVTPLHDVIARRGARVVPGTPLIGYRRRPVTVNLPGGWRISIPGSFTESWDEEGTYCAAEPPRTLWCSSFTYRDKDGSLVAAEQLLTPPGTESGERIELTGPAAARQVGRAYLNRLQEGGKIHWELAGESAVPGSLATCTIAFDDARDREWAISTWRGLTYGAPGGS
jgi:hypothetical protein